MSRSVAVAEIIAEVERERMRRAKGHIRWWYIAGTLALVALLDFYELFVTIPELARIANEPIFEIRLHGYGMGEAIQLFTALGPEGRAYYLERHLPADTALAITESVALVLIILRSTRPNASFSVAMLPAWRVAIMAPPLITLLFDLSENALLTSILLSDSPDKLSVALASLSTQAKWVFASISIALALVLPVTALQRGFRRKVNQPGQQSPH